jgi:Phosphopantothenoylcysteine synthetase/decarboxylase
MKVLITSGGTIEKIDAVKSISNTSTGKLGSLIADSFSSRNIEKLVYVCSASSIRPKTEKAEIVLVDSVASLENTVKRILSESDFDIIIHSMAVSDYRVKAVTSCGMIAENILLQNEELDLKDSQKAHDYAARLLNEAQSVIGSEGKISSDVDDMVLLMERTPKIISLYKSLAPRATLVGFKLLDNVSIQTLLSRGYKVLTDNNCSFVLANDYSKITEDKHIGYLIDRDKNYNCYETKQEIADAIVSAAINERGKI